MYIFGRYSHLDEFLIIGVFNLLLAKDIYLLYDLLKQYINQYRKDTEMESIEDKNSISNQN